MRSVMFIGLINSDLKERQNIVDSYDRIYYESNKYCWDGYNGKAQGNGFEEGQTVTVEIDF